jgi:hypothetical protein
LKKEKQIEKQQTQCMQPRATYLDVPVNDLASVHVEDRLEQLVDDVALVHVLQDIRLDHIIQVGFLKGK